MNILNRKQYQYIFVFVFLLIPQSVIYADSDLVKQYKHSYLQFQKHWNASDYKKALPYSKSAYELGQKLYQPGDKKILVTQHNYGVALYTNRQYEQSLKILNAALAEYKQLYGESSMKLVDILMDLGKVYSSIGGRPRAAVRKFRGA